MSLIYSDSLIYSGGCPLSTPSTPTLIYAVGVPYLFNIRWWIFHLLRCPEKLDHSNVAA